MPAVLTADAGYCSTTKLEACEHLYWILKSPPAASDTASCQDQRGAEQPVTSIPAGEWTASSDQKLAKRYTPIEKGLRR